MPTELSAFMGNGTEVAVGQVYHFSCEHRTGKSTLISFS
jgi:hypothetical protein